MNSVHNHYYLLFRYLSVVYSCLDILLYSLYNHCYLLLLCSLSTLRFITMQILGTVFYSSIHNALFLCSAFQATTFRHLVFARNKYCGEPTYRHGLLVWSQQVRLCKQRRTSPIFQSQTTLKSGRVRSVSSASVHTGVHECIVLATAGRM